MRQSTQNKGWVSGNGQDRVIKITALFFNWWSDFTWWIGKDEMKSIKLIHSWRLMIIQQNSGLCINVKSLREDHDKCTVTYASTISQWSLFLEFRDCLSTNLNQGATAAAPSLWLYRAAKGEYKGGRLEAPGRPAALGGAAREDRADLYGWNRLALSKLVGLRLRG